jgi:hypothetical protein
MARRVRFQVSCAAVGAGLVFTGGVSLTGGVGLTGGVALTGAVDFTGSVLAHNSPPSSS